MHSFQFHFATVPHPNKMNRNSPYCILFFALLFCATTLNLQVEGTECGETFEVEEYGSISYKLGEDYASNERCVFTVRIPRAAYIRFEMMESGISTTEANDGVSISTFRLNNPPLSETKFIKATQESYTMQGGVAVITFMTQEASAGKGTGFVLYFSATNLSGGISLKSSDFISNNLNGVIDYPGNGDNYDDNEVSTFVFTTPNFSVDNAPRQRVTWTKYGLEGGCQDQIFMFKFYPTAVDGWSHFESYCPASPRTTSHTDMLLYVFRTDSSVTGPGFRFQWEEFPTLN